MFDITSVTTASGAHTYVLFGGPSGHEAVSPTAPLGPEGATYILAFPGLGYMKLTDVGSSGTYPFFSHSYGSSAIPSLPVSGPGDCSVKVSGTRAGGGNWFYNGEGECRVSVDSSGNYTVHGGVGTVLNGHL